MATTKVAIAPMKVAQDIPSREPISKSLNARFPSRVPDRCGSRCRLVVFATVTRSQKKALPGIQYPRVPGHEVAGIIDEAGCWCFRVEDRDSASASAGTAATMARAFVPARRFSQLPESENSGHQL